MRTLIFLLLTLTASLFRSKSRLEAENARLREQLNRLQRKIRDRIQLENDSRLGDAQLFRWFPSVL
jgi:hypothetical protein